MRRSRNRTRIADSVLPLEELITEMQFCPSTRRGQPSPTGRGQGEGSDVTFTLAVIGTGASNLSQRFRTNAVTRVLSLVKCDACTPTHVSTDFRSRRIPGSEPNHG